MASLQLNRSLCSAADPDQVAYLMADVSDVQANDIKEIYDGLEALSCKSCSGGRCWEAVTNLDHNSTYSGSRPLLRGHHAIWHLGISWDFGVTLGCIF